MTRSARLGNRAVVAGGSLAGLLAARVLADFYDEVVVIDRDAISDAVEDRRMTPQSKHVHILLKGGEMAIESLLPDFVADMAAAGSEPVDPGTEMLMGNEHGFAPKWNGAPWPWLMQSRAMLEHLVRRRVAAYSTRIVQRNDCTVRGLTLTDGSRRVNGVGVETAAGGRETVAADLVIDATGRGAGAMRWLSALGLPTPEVEEVKVDFGYSSAVFRLKPDPQRDWKGALCGTLPPKTYGLLIAPIENGLHICSAGGRFGDFPPDDLDGYIDYIDRIGQPVFPALLREAEQVTELVSMRFEYNRFRHYERMDDLPEGFIPIGDALCSVNPTYGQGMSSTAKQVLSLQSALGDLASKNASLAEIARTHLAQAAAVALVPWRQACFTDFAFPQTEGDRSMFSPEEAKIRMAAQELSMRDEELRLRLFKIGQLVEPPGTVYEDEAMLARIEAFATDQARKRAAAATD